MLEALCQALRREQLDVRRRQLDGQRYPIDAPADLGHGACIAGCERKARLGRLRSLHKKLDGGAPCGGQAPRLRQR